MPMKGLDECEFCEFEFLPGDVSVCRACGLQFCEDCGRPEREECEDCAIEADLNHGLTRGGNSDA